MSPPGEISRRAHFFLIDLHHSGIRQQAGAIGKHDPLYQGPLVLLFGREDVPTTGACIGNAFSSVSRNLTNKEFWLDREHTPMQFFKELKKQSDNRWLKSAREAGEIVDGFLEEMDGTLSDSCAGHSILLLAVSPRTPIAYAIATRGEKLARLGLSLRFVFCDAEDREAMHAFIEAVQECIEIQDRIKSGRWASNPCLADANEQLIMGTKCCLTGDTLRRGTAGSNATYIHDTDASGSVRFARSAYEEMWRVSRPMQPHDAGIGMTGKLNGSEVFAKFEGTGSSPMGQSKLNPVH